MGELTEEATVSVVQGTVVCTVNRHRTSPLVSSWWLLMSHKCKPHPHTFTLTPTPSHSLSCSHNTLTLTLSQHPHTHSFCHIHQTHYRSLWWMLQRHLWLCFWRMSLPSFCWRAAVRLSHKWVMSTWYAVACTLEVIGVIWHNVHVGGYLYNVPRDISQHHHVTTIVAIHAVNRVSHLAQAATHSSSLHYIHTPTEGHWVLCHKLNTLQIICLYCVCMQQHCHTSVLGY